MPKSSENLLLDQEELSKIAYIREMPRSEALAFARSVGIEIGVGKLYALHAADGTKLAVSDDPGAARANAEAFGLTPVTLH